MPKIKRTYATIFTVLLVLTLFLTRFVNLSWGLPEHFHPDERNIAVAVQQLNCNEFQSLRDCLNPHFFAYGQPTIYLGYIITRVFHLGAAFSLRLISSFFSIALVWIMWKLLKEMNAVKDSRLQLSATLLFIFSPVLIQFAHFGTTESVLMFLYVTLVFISLRFLNATISKKVHLYLSSFLTGLATSVKVSSGIFILVPLLAIVQEKKSKLSEKLIDLAKLGVLILLIAVIFSPHNIISWQDFSSSLRYEASVAQGLNVFYTRSFFRTTPVVYQFMKIFPYALGFPALALFILGFFFLPYNKQFNLLRASFLVYFLPTSFLYAKWTRFMAPVFPIMLLFSALFALHFLTKSKKLKLFFYILILSAIIPGIAYLSIYIKPDTRIEASRWIHKNIPSGSYILTETANVVDIPIPQENKGKSYILNSFDFYHLDEDRSLQDNLRRAITYADYILVPSRRVHKNHTCLTEKTQSSKLKTQKCEELKKKYPILNEYYRKLFSGELGFVKVAEFSSYSSIKVYGKTLLSFPDEDVEETWTVFDHPVVRIYKKI